MRVSETLALLIDRVETPIGEMLIVADREGNLRSVGWADHETGMHCICAFTTARMDSGSNRPAIRMA